MNDGRKNPHPGIKLTSRDIQLLRYLNEFGFATLELIWTKFWHREPSFNHIRRTRQLFKHGYIEPLKGEYNERLAYRLSAGGIKKLRADGILNANAVRPRARYQRSLKHDERVNQLHHALEGAPSIRRIITENDLRAMQPLPFRKHSSEVPVKRPDLLLHLDGIDGDDIVLAVEVELSIKSRARYRQILQHYASYRDAHMILYVFEEDAYRLRFSSHLRSLEDDDSTVYLLLHERPMYFAMLNDLLQLADRCPIESYRTSIKSTLRDLSSNEPRTKTRSST